MLVRCVVMNDNHVVVKFDYHLIVMYDNQVSVKYDYHLGNDDDRCVCRR